MQDKTEFKNNEYKGFTLAETMVTLLIISILTATFLPVLTRRLHSRVSEGSTTETLWAEHSTGDVNNIKPKDSGRVAIGTGSSGFSSGENSALLISTKDNTQKHIIFENLVTPQGELAFDTSGNLFFGRNITNFAGNLGGNIAIGNDIVSTQAATDGNSIKIGNSIGYQSGASTSGNNVLIGSIISSKGTYNVGIGYDVMVGSTNTEGAIAVGRYVSAIGNQAIAVGIGTSSIRTAATGNNTVAMGASATATATGLATNAIALGANSSASCDLHSCIAIGSGSARATATQGALDGAMVENHSAVAIGTSSRIEASASTAIGYKASAGRPDANGDDGHTAIGRESVATATGSDGLEGAIAIGYTAKAYNGGIAIGRNAQATGPKSIAIGTDSLASALNSVAIGRGAQSTTADQITLGTSTDTVQFSGIYLSSHINQGGFPGSFMPSDKRIKNIKGETNLGLEEVLQLQPYNFSYIRDKDKTPSVGFIAQDVQKILPQLVSKDKEGFLTLKTTQILYIMINAVKQLNKMQAEISQLAKSLQKEIKSVEAKLPRLVNINNNADKEIARLESKNKALATRISKLEKMIESR